MEPMKFQKRTYALPFITGRTYNLWWLTGLDFDYLEMSSTNLFTSNDDGIIFKFNYTLNRELYEIGPNRPHAALTPELYFTQSIPLLDETSCFNG